MKISVIIPTYNRSHLLARALQSVIHQSYQPFEVIVIDDGSTDNTAELIQTQFPMVRYHYQEQGGVSKARNLGIRIATGDWLAFLDSDDQWHLDKLNQQVNALRDAPDKRICHTNENWIRDGKRVNPMKKHEKFGGWIFKACLPLCRISPSSVMIHQDIFTQLGGFDESLPACEDYDLWLRITAKYPVLYLKQALTIKYGGHQDQLSKKYWGMDRFRIQSLHRLLQNEYLSVDNYTAAVAVLQEKITIYLKGARKRNKLKEINYYEKIRQSYTNQCETESRGSTSL